MKIKELLITENVEDEQAEANEHTVTLLMMAKTFMDENKFASLKKRWEQANDDFSEWYENEDEEGDEDGMDEAIGDIIAIGEEVEPLVKKEFKDKFESSYKEYENQTDEFD